MHGVAPPYTPGNDMYILIRLYMHTLLTPKTRRRWTKCNLWLHPKLTSATVRGGDVFPYTHCIIIILYCCRRNKAQVVCRSRVRTESPSPPRHGILRWKRPSILTHSNRDLCGYSCAKVAAAIVFCRLGPIQLSSGPDKNASRRRVYQRIIIIIIIVIITRNVYIYTDKGIYTIYISWVPTCYI